jgi:putative endonuclease
VGEGDKRVLVWFEQYGTMELAIAREKQLKNWHRAWKVKLIEESNPHWADLAVGLGLSPLPVAKPNHGCWNEVTVR